MSEMVQWIKLFRIVFKMETGVDIGLKMSRDAYWRCKMPRAHVPGPDPMKTLEEYQCLLKKHGLI